MIDARVRIPLNTPHPVRPLSLLHDIHHILDLVEIFLLAC